MMSPQGEALKVGFNGNLKLEFLEAHSILGYLGLVLCGTRTLTCLKRSDTLILYGSKKGHRQGNAC